MSKSFIIKKRPLLANISNETREEAWDNERLDNEQKIRSNVTVLPKPQNKIIKALESVRAGKVKILKPPHGKPPNVITPIRKNTLNPAVAAIIKDNSKLYEVTGPNFIKPRVWNVLSVYSTAEAIGVSSLTLSTWIKSEMMPEPILKRTDTPVGSFYHEQEVCVIAKHFLEHQEQFRYYRKDHLELRKKLNDGIGEIRNLIFR